MQDRCGICRACMIVENTKDSLFKTVNPPFSHATDDTVMIWNDVLDMNPCEEWGLEEDIRRGLRTFNKLLGLYATNYRERSYVPTGTCSPSECAVHSGYVGKRIAKIMLNIRGTYAIVLFEDGTIGEGTWYEYMNGDYTLG